MRLNGRYGMEQSNTNNHQTMIEINREGNWNYEAERKARMEKEAEKEWVQKLARKVGFGKNFIK